MLWPDLSSRHLEGELMDQPQLEWPQHEHALRGLKRINRISHSARLLLGPLEGLSRRLERAVRILDVASGGGDVPIELYRLANSRGMGVEIEGCDVSGRAVDYANRAAAGAGAPVRFFRMDALAESMPESYDAITASLFLHHLSDAEGEMFLRKAARAAGQMVLINDLVRSAGGYAMAAVGTWVLSRSRVIHVDGRLSVRAALTVGEAREMAARAGLEGARVEARWPMRYLLEWSRR